MYTWSRTATSPTWSPSTTPSETKLAEVFLDLLCRLDRYYQGPGGASIAMPYIAG